MRPIVAAFVLALLPATAFAQVENDGTRAQPTGRPQFAPPNAAGLGGGGGGGLGGGGNALAQPPADHAQARFQRLVSGSIALNSVDFSVPLGIDGYECDLEHEVSFDRARRRGLSLHPKSPLPVGRVDQQQIGRICQFFKSWAYAPSNRMDYFCGIRLKIFVIGGWWGELQSRTPFPGGEIIRVWVRPQLEVGGVLLAEIPYYETYILSPHGTLTYHSCTGPEAWRGRNPIAAIVSANSPTSNPQLTRAHP